MSASVIPEEGHFRFGQAKPWVFTRLGAPRRLFTSCQGRTGAGSTPNSRVEARHQAGQSRGERGGAGDVGPPCATPQFSSGEDNDGARKGAKAMTGRE